MVFLDPSEKNKTILQVSQLKEQFMWLKISNNQNYYDHNSLSAEYTHRICTLSASQCIKVRLNSSGYNEIIAIICKKCLL